MNVTPFDHAAKFQPRVLPLLMAREAENNLMIGIVARLAGGESANAGDGTAPPRFWLVEDGGQVVAAAAIMPPYRLTVTRLVPGAAEWLAAAIHSAAVDLPGVLGPRDAADQFAAAWHAQTGVEVKTGHELCTFQLDRVTPPAGVPGWMETPTIADLELVVRWAAEFSREAELGAGPPIERMRGRISSGEIVLWHNPDPVAIAAAGSPTPNGIRIGLVYTPPQHRRRGCASALVAALSQRLLDSGRKFCFLFTDLANPTSNSIYQKIGYRPVCEFQEYDFVKDG